MMKSDFFKEHEKKHDKLNKWFDEELSFDEKVIAIDTYYKIYDSLPSIGHYLNDSKKRCVYEIALNLKYDYCNIETWKILKVDL